MDAHIGVGQVVMKAPLALWCGVLHGVARPPLPCDVRHCWSELLQIGAISLVGTPRPRQHVPPPLATLHPLALPTDGKGHHLDHPAGAADG